jgi:hypothetical protein
MSRDHLVDAVQRSTRLSLTFLTLQHDIPYRRIRLPSLYEPRRRRRDVSVLGCDEHEFARRGALYCGNVNRSNRGAVDDGIVGEAVKLLGVASELSGTRCPEIFVSRKMAGGDATSQSWAELVGVGSVRSTPWKRVVWISALPFPQ